MTDEQIVMNRWKNSRYLGKSTIEFKIRRMNWEDDVLFRNRQIELEERIEFLKHLNSVVDRVNEILRISGVYSTYFAGTNRFQCNSGARRSTNDIWRIYKNYFEEVDLFTIMRALFVLVRDTNLDTMRCSTVRKRVFWFSTWSNKDYHTPAELGVPLSRWKDIGLNQNEQTQA